MRFVVCAFDFETTGLDWAADDIIQVGACARTGTVDPDTGRFIPDQSFEIPPHRFERYVATDCELSHEVQRLTSITPDKLQDADRLPQVLRDFATWLSDLRTQRADSSADVHGSSKLVLVSYNGLGYHNPGFDMNVLAWQLVKFGTVLESFLTLIEADAHDDVMRSVDSTWSLERIRLVDVYKHVFRKQYEAAHSAAADANATLSLFFKLRTDLRHSLLGIDNTLAIVFRDSGLSKYKVYDRDTRLSYVPRVLKFRCFSCMITEEPVVPFRTKKQKLEQ